MAESLQYAWRSVRSFGEVLIVSVHADMHTHRSGTPRRLFLYARPKLDKSNYLNHLGISV